MAKAEKGLTLITPNWDTFKTTCGSLVFRDGVAINAYAYEMLPGNTFRVIGDMVSADGSAIHSDVCLLVKVAPGGTIFNHNDLESYKVEGKVAI